MRRLGRGRRAALALIATIVAGCAAPAPRFGPAPPGLFPPRPGAPAVRVHVVTHAWHTGLAARVADLPPGLWPARRDFPRARRLEVGWGDRAYWIAERPGAGLALAAVLLPTPATVRVVAVGGPVERAFPASDVLALDLSPAGFERLARFVDAAWERDAAGQAVLLPAPVPGLRFYAGRGRYGGLANSNTWTARALAAAGVPVTPGLALTAWGVVCQVVPFARIVRLETYRAAAQGC